MSSSEVVETKFADFPSEFRGQVYRPGDADYAEVRTIFNSITEEWQPALIVRPVDPDDVVTAVKWANAADIPIAVKGGGHGTDNLSMPDGAFVIDMANFKEASYDASTNRAAVGAGVRLGEMDPALYEHGVAVPAGTVGTTGVAGLILGGGIGYNMRKYGATVDRLRAVDIVTVDGRKVRASADENADLFWALRGGGGNFGIATRFEFDAVPVRETVLAGFIPFTLDQAPTIFKKLREYGDTAPRELQVITSLTECPPLPGLSDEQIGVKSVIFIVVYTGDNEEGQKYIDELAAFGDPTTVFVQPTPWPVANRMLDIIAPEGRRTWSKGGYIAELTDELIADAVGLAQIAPDPTSPPLPGIVQNFWIFGGAISEDFDEDSVAFSRANASFLWEAVVAVDDIADQPGYLSWLDGADAKLSPHFLPNVYINLTTDKGAEWRSKVWGSEEKYARLVAQKTKWDPKNLLRYNKNIPPAAA